jgi:RNA polymerase sigma-70 factor (ECF subfamily)
MSQDKDQDIIERVLGGERDAYAALVDRYKGPIFNLAYRMTGSHQDADDLTQDTFIRAYAALRSFKKGSKFFTWLYTISLNLVRNHLKKGIPLQTLESDCQVPSREEAHNPEGCAIRQDEVRALNASLYRLPEALREAVVLRFYQGLSFEDIAEVSGGSLSGAKMNVYRGLEKLRLLMREERPDQKTG